MVGEIRSEPAVTDSANTDSVSRAVVSVVADRSGVDPTELPPLHGAVDPEALDSLFAGDVGGRAEFRYNGFDVVVHGDGRVAVSG